MRPPRSAAITSLAGLAAASAVLLSGCDQVHNSMEDILASAWAERADDVDRVTAVRDACAPDSAMAADAFSVQVIDGDATQADVVHCIAAALDAPELDAALDAETGSGNVGVLHVTSVGWTTQGRVFTATVEVGAFA